MHLGALSAGRPACRGPVRPGPGHGGRVPTGWGRCAGRREEVVTVTEEVAASPAVERAEEPLVEAAGAGGPGRGLRRRRANVVGGRRHAHRVLVTPEEEARLLLLAGEAGVTVPRLLVEAALAPARGETATSRRDVLAELFAVRRLLAGVASNVNQVAKVANSMGRVAPETDGVLDAVVRLATRVDGLVDELGAGRARRSRRPGARSTTAGRTSSTSPRWSGWPRPSTGDRAGRAGDAEHHPRVVVPRVAGVPRGAGTA